MTQDPEPIIWIENYRLDGQLQSVYQYINKATEKRKSYIAYLPSKWKCISALFCIFMGISLIVALVIFIFAPRLGLFHESCQFRPCMPGLSLKCINGICQCPNGYYYLKGCKPNKEYLEICSSNNTSCKEKTNLLCINGICQCMKSQYWNGEQCVSQKLNGESCKNIDECLSESMLYCNTKTGKCACKSDR